MSKRAEYEKAKRERLKAAGLEKSELWTTPENKQTLKAIEKIMRKYEITVSNVCEVNQSLDIKIIKG